MVVVESSYKQSEWITQTQVSNFETIAYACIVAKQNTFNGHIVMLNVEISAFRLNWSCEKLFRCSIACNIIN